MNKVIEELCNVLQSELDVYKSELNIAERKKKQVIDNNLTEMKKINNEEQNVFYKIVDLEDKRKKITKIIAESLNVNSQDLTISEIINLSNENMLIDSKLLLELSNLKQELSDLINEIKKANDLNKKLIDSSLEYIDFSINLMMGSTNQSIYGNNGQYDDIKVANKRFDIKY